MALGEPGFPDYSRKRLVHQDDLIEVVLGTTSSEDFIQDTWRLLNDNDSTFVLSLTPGFWDIAYNIEIKHRISGSGVDITNRNFVILRNQSTLDHIQGTITKSSAFINASTEDHFVSHTLYIPTFKVESDIILEPWALHNQAGTGSVGLTGMGGQAVVDGVSYNRSTMWARKIRPL